jgi:uncharacterized protein YgfB (UPF0149 family)
MMDRLSATDWALVGDALRRVGSLGEAAEIHGEIHGLLCTMGKDAIAPWVKGALSDAPTAPTDVVTMLETLGEEAHAALESGDMSLVLLLPEDNASLEIRAEALGHWCQGFMHGLGASGQRGNEKALIREGATRDIILDFSEITRASFAEDETEEEGEAALVQLIEYVRVSVQLVYEELLKIRVGPGQSSAH